MFEDNRYETTQECLKTTTAKTTQECLKTTARELFKTAAKPLQNHSRALQTAQEHLKTTASNHSGILENGFCNTAQGRLKTTATKTTYECLKTTATSRSRTLENNSYKPLRNA